MMIVLLSIVGLLCVSRGVSGEAVSFSLNNAAPSSSSLVLAPTCRISTTVTFSQKRITADFGSVLETSSQAVEDVDANDEDSVVLASTFNSHLAEAGVSSTAVNFDSQIPSNAEPSVVAGGAETDGTAANNQFDYIPDFRPYPGPIYPGYCPSIVAHIEPIWALNSQHQWVRIFQAYYFRQRFPVVYCISAYCNQFYINYQVGTQDSLSYFPPIGRCYVKYRYFYAVVITGCGGIYNYYGGLSLQVQAIRLPGSCTCRNDFIWPFYKK
ncbi:uncharacterized protein LOC117119836 [Anneissia japonica]|uniref:uncharacterized protein LOC117119836 n=1 Tax=Anneissia japonica TaxID=1529436 RepID=UPI00142556DB|nr:uncharacterized protein LOC117119836 [Anneissia japonica]